VSIQSIDGAMALDDILPIIGQLYDAAVDPELWQPVLASLDQFFNTVQTFVVMENAIDPAASVFHASVSDPAWLRRYAEKYMLINPMRLATLGRVTVGTTVLTTDFMTPDEYNATRFSRELLAEKGVVDIAVAVLELTASRVTVLSAQRSVRQGFADEVLRRKLEIIMPHAQRAVRIAGLLEHQKMVASSVGDTLDMLAAGVFLVTGKGIVVHANTRAMDFVSENDIVRIVGGGLALTDRTAQAALLNAIGRAVQGDGVLGEAGQAIVATSGAGRRIIATVMPLTNGRRSTIGASYRAVAAVCLQEAEFEASADAAALALLYDLTARETTILITSIEVTGASEVAGILGISEATVKSHLKAIFRKTGVNRQSDLVKLVAAAKSPFGKPAR
jgi:DNA-binding CsgD family transcriptional regulator